MKLMLKFFAGTIVFILTIFVIAWRFVSLPIYALVKLPIVFSSLIVYVIECIEGKEEAKKKTEEAIKQILTFWL